ncbi:unnamed protein product [Pipistrellus nathusii]|uniref:Uncharacterized protein n=1 Tax=Pipistrellus nathusii TaxID=59473 RepID=A0ABP0A776_PIPNA
MRGPVPVPDLCRPPGPVDGGRLGWEWRCAAQGPYLPCALSLSPGGPGPATYCSPGTEERAAPFPAVVPYLVRHWPGPPSAPVQAPLEGGPGRPDWPGPRRPSQPPASARCGPRAPDCPQVRLLGKVRGQDSPPMGPEVESSSELGTGGVQAAPAEDGPLAEQTGEARKPGGSCPG